MSSGFQSDQAAFRTYERDARRCASVPTVDDFGFLRLCNITSIATVAMGLSPEDSPPPPCVPLGAESVVVFAKQVFTSPTVTSLHLCNAVDIIKGATLSLQSQYSTTPISSISLDRTTTFLHPRLVVHDYLVRLVIPTSMAVQLTCHGQRPHGS